MKAGNWAQRNPLALAFIIMIVSIGGTWITLNGRLADKDKQIEGLTAALASKDRELKEWQLIVVPQLEKIKPTVEATAQVIDSITQKQ